MKTTQLSRVSSNPRQALRHVATACLAALALISCGGGGGDTTASSGVSASTAPTTDLSGISQSLDVGFTPSVAPAQPVDPNVTPTNVPTNNPPSSTPGQATGGSSPQTLNVFYSGHSLIDRPLPDTVETIASSLGKTSRWNQQNIVGSPIRARTRGFDYNASDFSGYRLGANREGDNMDVVAELRNPRTIGGQKYHAMVLAERHDLPITREGEDGLRFARHIHERLIEGNPEATTYLYHAWWHMYDRGNPGPWINYERQAAPIWQCVVARVNTSLRLEGRSDRMQYLPSGIALVELVERATRGNVPGITAGSTFDTVARLFYDDVHLTSLGRYYMSLVVYASLFRSPPTDAWVPEDVSPVAAASLKSIAWNVVANHYASATEPKLEDCAAYSRSTFCAATGNFLRIPQGINNCIQVHGYNDDRNPYYFNAATDRNSWLPAP
jgi:hypothetical protein